MAKLRMNIRTFLRERLDELEYLALTAATVSPRWSTLISDDGGPSDIIAKHYSDDADLMVTINADVDSPSVHEDAAAHIVAHDPSSVLADIKMKRALIAAEPSLRFSRQKPKLRVTDDGALLIHRGGYWQATSRAELVAKYTTEAAPTMTLKILASPYSAHPDFEQAWAVKS